MSFARYEYDTANTCPEPGTTTIPSRQGHSSEIGPGVL